MSTANPIPEVLEEDFRSIDPALLEPVRGRTVAISGATGFIGSLLARYLLWANDRHDAGVRLVLCARHPERFEDIAPEFKGRSGVRYVPVDFSRPCEPLAEPSDLLVHTAAITQSKVMRERPADVLRVGLNGTTWALDSARLYGGRVLNLSSMEAVGTFSEPTVADETTSGAIDLSSTRSCYPESKRLGELACLCWAAQYGVDACTARLAQTFGAGVNPNDNRVFMQLARAAMADRPIVLRTDGLGEGNYVYSADALSAILTLLAKGRAGETYDVANEACHTTIRAMAELVAREFGGPHTTVEYDIADPGTTGYAAPTRMTLSSAKLRALGWKPMVDLVEAYRRLIGWLDSAVESAKYSE